MTHQEKPGVPARRAAVTIVNRVVRSGAFSNIVTATETTKLPDAERRQALHLAYGVLRQLPRLDRVIAGFSQRSSLEPIVEDTLRVAVFELLFSSSPPHAAVDTAVATVRSFGSGRAAGFVNGLLRSVVRVGEPPLPDGPEGRALSAGVPGWLVEHLDSQWPAEETDRFLDASQEEPAIGVRRRGDETAPAGVEAVTGIDGAFVASHVPEGWIVQDPASVAVGLAVAPRDGETILDMAAAPGGKTMHLADQAAVTLVAADRNRRRIRRAQRRMSKHGVSVPWVVADGRQSPFRESAFDAVLLDAPCTGLGTLRRRPEIRFKSSPADIARLAALQEALLESAVRLVRPGGRVVYSVCTVTEAETVRIVEGFEASPPEGLPGEVRGKGSPAGAPPDGYRWDVHLRDQGRVTPDPVDPFTLSACNRSRSPHPSWPPTSPSSGKR